MPKSNKLLLFTLSFFFIVLPVFLFADESLTITTYYPSPYGSYSQLTADQIAIGSGYRNPTYADGTLYVQNNVGIGTTSPKAPLHIFNGSGGRLILDDATGNHWTWLIGQNVLVNNSIEITPSSEPGGYIYDVPTKATALTIFGQYAGSKVGIEIPYGSLPSRTLDVRGTVRLGVTDIGDGDNTWTKFDFGGGGADNKAIIYATAGNYLSLGSNGNFDQVNIVNGNVGIGTTSPGYGLEVNRYDAKIGIPASGGFLTLGGSPSANGWSGIYLIGSNIATNWFIGQNATRGSCFEILPSTVPGGSTFTTPAFAISGSNYVGIGTTVPGAKLDIVGPNINGAYLSEVLRFRSADYPNYYGSLYADMSGVSAGMSIGVNGTKAIYFALNGNVGIGGTTSPGYALTVAGTAWCTSGIWSGSDLRWKKNIVSLDNPISKLSKLRGVKYDWRRQEFKANHFPEGRQIGIIAQEMEKEYPELVNTDKDGYKAIAYDRFSGVLLEAIKAQQKEIETLQKQVQELRKKEGTSPKGTKLFTNTWTIASDSRLKKDIRPYTNGLKIIKQIKPVWFKYNGKAGFPDDNQNHIGVIGQEIIKVAPYTVNTFKAKLNPQDKEETELLNFNSHALTFDLINSVKELDSNITKLSQENQELKKADKELKSELENLETRLRRLEARK